MTVSDFYPWNLARANRITFTVSLRLKYEDSAQKTKVFKLGLSEKQIKQLATLSSQLSMVLGDLVSTRISGVSGCSGSCEGGCTGCGGCSGCTGCSGSSQWGSGLSLDDMVNVLDHLDTLGPLVLSPELLKQAIKQKRPATK